MRVIHKSSDFGKEPKKKEDKNIVFGAQNISDELDFFEKAFKKMAAGQIGFPFCEKVKQWLHGQVGLHQGQAYQDFLIGFRESETKEDLIEKLRAFNPDSPMGGPSYYLALLHAFEEKR